MIRTLPSLRRAFQWLDALTFPLWGALYAVAWLLRWANRNWRGPSVLAGANDDPRAKRAHEEAGAIWADMARGDE